MDMKRLSDLVVHPASVQPRMDGTRMLELEWEEVAGALALVPGIGAALARCMYADDARAGREVVRRLQGFLLAYSLPPDVRLALAEFSLRVFVMPPLCPACGGRAAVVFEQLLQQCPACYGVGMKSPGPATLAFAFGRCNRDGWIRDYEGAFNACTSVLRRWHDEAAEIISRQLRVTAE